MLIGCKPSFNSKLVITRCSKGSKSKWWVNLRCDNVQCNGSFNWLLKLWNSTDKKNADGKMQSRGEFLWIKLNSNEIENSMTNICVIMEKYLLFMGCDEMLHKFGECSSIFHWFDDTKCSIAQFCVIYWLLSILCVCDLLRIMSRLLGLFSRILLINYGLNVIRCFLLHK